MRKETYRARAIENSCREKVDKVVCGEGWKTWEGCFILDDDDGDTYRVDESTLVYVPQTKNKAQKG